ncbi:hypothetical protein N183_38110 [Sinorhizobium sp. Sb3]|nr:hypothetical protein N183_38110 [Sinorhizobium sp. Sb3]
MAARHGESEPEDAGRLSIPVLLSAGWILCAVYLGWNARPCDFPNESPVSCLSANEWGVFLTRVFAPLVFIWLVTMVCIQFIGLREQRNDLA